jgi:hypothetical protein
MIASEFPQFGASFSLHRCHELGLDPKKLLTAAIEDVGFRRFRLMSYWNIHELSQGTYDFTELDWQMDVCATHDCAVSLSIGKRQPRWPECHIPDWALQLSKQDWQSALMKYLEAVVNRYKNHPALVSWQLENEALLKSFGYCRDGDYSRHRLRNEFDLVTSLDTSRPVIMTLSDSWGLPIRRPKPNMYAMSLYRATINKNGRYTISKRDPGFYRLRAKIIQLLKRRPVFIHELQAEPWLSTAITEAPVAEQLKRFNVNTLEQNVIFARQTGLIPIDLWGLEWWYWLKEKHGNATLWKGACKMLK